MSHKHIEFDPNIDDETVPLENPDEYNRITNILHVPPYQSPNECKKCCSQCWLLFINTLVVIKNFLVIFIVLCIPITCMVLSIYGLVIAAEDTETERPNISLFWAILLMLSIFVIYATIVGGLFCSMCGKWGDALRRICLWLQLMFWIVNPLVLVPAFWMVIGNPYYAAIPSVIIVWVFVLSFAACYFWNGLMSLKDKMGYSCYDLCWSRWNYKSKLWSAKYDYYREWHEKMDVDAKVDYILGNLVRNYCKDIDGNSLRLDGEIQELIYQEAIFIMSSDYDECKDL